MLTENDRATSVVFVVGESTNGNVQPCKSSLFSKHVHEVSGTVDELIGLAFDGCYSLTSGEPVPSCQFQSTTMCAGKETQFVLAASEEIYSWGVGPFGELGQGLCKTKVDNPTAIQHKASFVQLSCGDYHSAALDSIGNAYCWGQNFDRQLGLYTKKSTEFSKPNCLVEDMSFVPVLLPFSIKSPIIKIACGAMFTVAISKAGQLYSWGAGECGQLGTGRCTRKEVPSLVTVGSSPSGEENNNNNMAGIRIGDVACGDSHAIVVTADDKNIYAWGMNKRGQLGLGDTTTRHQPVKIEGLTLSKVFAGGNSTAGVTLEGQLYTWGSGSKYRLMQANGDDSHRNVPTEVQALKGCIVHRFAFSGLGSAALVVTRLYRLSPSSGPQKTFSELKIHGCGFWDADSIIVKFSKRATGKEEAMGITLPPPRSTPGRLSASGVISCKPPKLAEAGIYDIAVSMDGEVFAKDVLAVEIYPDVTVAALAPKVIDTKDAFMNMGGSQSGHPSSSTTQITLALKGLKNPPENGLIDVKLVLTIAPEVSATVKSVRSTLGTASQAGSLTSSHASKMVAKTIEVKVVGRVVDVAVARQIEGVAAAGAASNMQGSPNQSPTASTVMTARTNYAPDTARTAVDSSLCYVACDIQEALRAAAKAAGTDGNLITIRGQVTLNNADYSPIAQGDNNTVIICHAFQANLLSPCSCMCPTDPTLPMGELKVVGQSFFVASEMPSSVYVQAVVCAKMSVQIPLMGGEGEEEEEDLEGAELVTVEESVEMVVPVKCLGQREMTFSSPSMTQMVACLSNARKPGAVVPPLSYLKATVRFELVISADGAPLPGIAAGGSISKSLLTPGSSAIITEGVKPASVLKEFPNPSLSLHQSTTTTAVKSVPPSARRGTVRNKAPPAPRKISLGDDGPPLVLELYVPQPIACAPTVCRRATGTLLTVTGTFPGGFRFRPTEARVLLSAQGGKWSETKAEVALSPEQLNILPPLPPSMRGQRQEVGGIGLENASEMSMSLVSEDGKGGVAAGEQGLGQGEGLGLTVDTLEPSVAEDVQLEDAQHIDASEGQDIEYKVQIALPEMSTVFAAAITDDNSNTAAEEGDAVAAVEMGPIGGLNVTLLLDGITPVPADFSAVVWLFDAVKINSVPNPKGGYLVGTGANVTVSVSGLPTMGSSSSNSGNTGSCLVRVRGEDTFVTITGTVQYATNEIVFPLPEADQLATMTPTFVKKAKFYFVDVSLDDGGSFDSSDTAILNVK